MLLAVALERCDAAAFSTCPTARDQRNIRAIEQVPAYANVLPGVLVVRTSAAPRPERVFTLRDRLQMRRVDAAWNTASVVYDEAEWNVAVREFVAETVRVGRAAWHAKLSVTAAHR